MYKIDQTALHTAKTVSNSHIYSIARPNLFSYANRKHLVYAQTKSIQQPNFYSVANHDRE